MQFLAFIIITRVNNFRINLQLTADEANTIYPLRVTSFVRSN